MSPTLPPQTIENYLTITGPAGELRLANDQDGLRVQLARLTHNTPSGYSFVDLDDPVPGHYYGWYPDWGSNGDYLAFYDNIINDDLFGVFHRGPYAGRFQIGLQNGPFALPARLNNREVWTEIDALKAQVAELQAQLATLRKPLPPQTPAPSTAL